MKKFLFVMLTVALALPMMAQIKVENKDAFKTAKFTHQVELKALNYRLVPAAMTPARGDIPEGFALVTLKAGDIWGDGSGYQMLLDADATAYGTIIPESGGLSTSGNVSNAVYAEFEYKIPENADGNMNTSNIVFDSEVSILIPAGVYDYCITNPTPDDRVWIASDNGVVPGRYDDFEFVEGLTYVFSIDIYGSNDGVALMVLEPGVSLTTPENVEVVPGANTANVSWDDDDDIIWNIRYRVFNPNAGGSFDFEDTSQLENWYIYDGDGDGYNWYYTSTSMAHSGEYVLASDSYYYGALEPDNWLISPEFALNGTLSFYASGSSPYYYDEVFSVYWGPSDWTSVDEFVPIQEYLVTDYGMNEYTFDLSDLGGQMGVIAIRHHACYDVYTLYLDDFKVGEDPNEWIVINGVEDVQTVLEGLDPETTYELQVQATGTSGFSSEWSETVMFTTTDGGEEPTERTAAPTYNGYTTDGIHAYFVEIIPTEPSIIYYRVQFPDGTWTEWAEYEDILSFTGNGQYRVEAYAVAPDKLPSYEIAYEFSVSPLTGLSEVASGKTVSSVRYFNAAGQEMSEANGLTIMVVTYTDGTTNAVKVVK